MKSLLSNTLYLALAVLFLTFGAYFQMRDIFTGLIITELLIIALPAFIFAEVFSDLDGKIKEGGRKLLNAFNYLRLKKTTFENIKKAIVITFITYPIAVFFNLIIIYIMGYLGYYNVPQVPMATDTTELFYYLLILALLPGVCEELLFRGFFLRANEEYGYRYSIFYSAILFALFHFNIYNFAGPLILGIVYGYVTRITRSVWPAIIAHTANNAIAASLGFLVTVYGPETSVDLESIFQDPVSMIIELSMLAVVALIAFLLLKSIIKSLRKSNDYIEVVATKIEKPSILSYVPIAITVGFFIIINYMYLMS
ncbi:membrane protease YdiL (CAAX protease family) [Acetoanaerobium pronyense]|uniref:Membrane protease YdiL (CAAX protease family) n=1 Tax=Acetoanaerobium pronyense TaxID=1482736 RepID=A0ABS4KIR8_9FIRM|nr:type II CAAX endopeptidase family protein [Acetoanaerobium pronyense]MBP2026524.1 membrane protease YdiL (CAAX protease family) [Acetoanaerobium pronyense]